KGSRNPYSFGVDPNSLGWLAWWECRPDSRRAEEHNFTTKPAFSGWPFFAGTLRQTSSPGSYKEQNEPTGNAWATFHPSTNDSLQLVNNWAQAQGYDTLPPMHFPYHEVRST